MLSGTGYSCHACYDIGMVLDGRMVARVAKDSEQSDLQWLCAEHLFNAVRDGRLCVSYHNRGPASFSGTEESGRWACYAHDCPNSNAQRVGELEGFPHELDFLCEDCLMRLVIDGTLTITEPGVKLSSSAFFAPGTRAAAPSGPTAKYDKDTGAVEIDGLTFRW